MLRPEDLYQVLDTGESVGGGGGGFGRVLLYVLDGFIDAGATGRLLVEHLSETLPHHRLVRFDTDLLHDYRARRPEVTFTEDHFSDWGGVELSLDAFVDDAGVGFLVLHGPEPDVAWERFAVAVVGLAERFDVSLAVGVHGIPMGVPHTRPLGLTGYASRPELVTRNNVWTGDLRLPGSAATLLHLRLAEAGRDAIGFAVHVPHYLAESRYPAATLVGLQAVSQATGLLLPTKGLSDEATVARAMIDEQVADSAEIQQLVRTLEEQFDNSGGAVSGAPEAMRMPSEDEIGDQVEKFLADLDRGQDS